MVRCVQAEVCSEQVSLARQDLGHTHLAPVLEFVTNYYYYGYYYYYYCYYNYVQASEYTRTSHLDSITIPQAPRLGTQVVEVENLCKSYGDRLLIKDLSFSVSPGSVVGRIPSHAGFSHQSMHVIQSRACFARSATLVEVNTRSLRKTRVLSQKA